MLYILLLLGFCIAPKPWFEGGPTLISNLLVKVVAPFYVFNSVITNLPDASTLLPLLPVLFWSALVMLMCIAISFALSYVLHIPRPRQGVFIAGASFPNVILLGFPIVESLYGEGAVQYGVVYFIANTFLFWSLCTFLLDYFGEDSGGGFSLKDNVRKIVSPALMAMVVGLVFVFFDIPMPSLASSVIGKLSQCMTGLAMIYIGAVMRQSKIGNMLLSKDLFFVVLLKLVVNPILLFFLLSVTPIPAEAKRVVYVITLMPVSVNFSVLSRQYKCDYEFAAIVSAALNILCIVVLPLYIAFLSNIWV